VILFADSLHQSPSIISDITNFEERAVQGLNLLLNSAHRISRPVPTLTCPAITAAANTASENLKRRYAQHILLASESVRADDDIEAKIQYQHAEQFYRTAALLKAGHQQ
jgi:hypothetical protein